MKKLKFKQVAENTESIYEFLETKPKLVIVKSILSDAIMFTRLSSKMVGVLNIFHPQTPVHLYSSRACLIYRASEPL